MKNLKIISISERELEFDNGYKLKSTHGVECCEDHYLDFTSIEDQEFNNLTFDIEGNFFERVPDYGIRLKPNNGWPLAIPGYGDNNGNYSEDIYLEIIDNTGKVIKEFDVTECQTFVEY